MSRLLCVHSATISLSLIAHNSVMRQKNNNKVEKQEQKQKPLLFSVRSNNKLIITITYQAINRRGVEMQQLDFISHL